MLDIKRNDVIKTHLKLSQTFKELKRVLPSGFIKTNIFSARVNPIRQQNTLINIKKGKKNKDLQSKLSEIIQNNNEYVFSEGNKYPKKIMSKISDYFSLNKQNNQLHSPKSDNNLNFSGNEYNTHTPSNKQMTKIPKIKINLNYLKGLNNKEKQKSNSKLYYNDIKLNHTLLDVRKSFKGTSIDNSMMKNNICLPSLTERLKTNLPRYAREKSGLLLKNYKNNYCDKSIVNVEEKFRKKINKNKKFKVIRFNNKYLNGANKKNKKVQLTNSFLKYLKMDEVVEIKSIRRLRKEQFY